jgi:signal transduction histidine kinase
VTPPRVDASGLAPLIAQCRARTRERVLPGLLHDLNAPLNNLGLTLTLLERALQAELRARSGDDGAGSGDDDVPPRLRRYLDTLHQECRRMGARTRTMAALAGPSMEPSDARDLREIVAEVPDLLRHYASLEEVRLEAAPGAADAAAVTNADVVREALLAIVAGAIARARPGGRVALEMVDGPSKAAMHISVTPAPEGAARAPAPARPVEMPEADLAAGRALIEALGGTAQLDETQERSVITVALPRA